MTLSTAATQSAGTAPSTDGSGGLDRQRRRLFGGFVGPAVALYVVLMIAPTIFTMWMSVNQWRAQGDEMNFVGFENFSRLFENSVFRTTFWNTLKILVVCGVAIFVLAFLMVVALREMKGRHVVRSMLFFPFIVSPVVIAVGLGLVLDPSGVVNGGLREIGLGALAISWLSPDHIFLTIVVTTIWVTTGFFVMLLMSGIERIPRYFYEDGEIAGAGAFQTFRFVTLPMIWDVLAVSAVLWVINAFKIFELIIAFSSLGDAPPIQARTLAVQQYYLTVGGRVPVYSMGQGAAIGVLTLVLVAVSVVLLRRILRRDRIEF